MEDWFKDYKRWHSAMSSCIIMDNKSVVLLYSEVAVRMFKTKTIYIQYWIKPRAYNVNVADQLCTFFIYISSYANSWLLIQILQNMARHAHTMKDI